MYRGRRPNRLARLMNRSGALLARTGMNRMRTLEVRHARTGRPLTLPVVPVPMDGTTYLVSMLGERANWVRHVRAADGRAVLHGRGRHDVVLLEVPPDLRPPVLRRYLDLAPGARPHIPVRRGDPLEMFERVKGDFPVFEVRVPRRPTGA
ncbi:MAG: nitroreductase family deazaflavin-dependent oxidoreductase [Thermoleophilia bacterium]|nr:nitroreductase family deazaflavin-dependent oxidoreductase [Thermoleophilia bacterium]